MKRTAIISIVVCVACGVLPEKAFATASFLRVSSFRLEIHQIGTGSIFDDIPGQDVDLSDFRITVDPLRQQPSLLVDTTERAAGFGDFTAEARADASLVAADPFRLQAGDVLSVFALAQGSASNGNGFSQAEAAAEATLFVVNDTDHLVHVDAIWIGDSSQDIQSAGFPGEEAWAEGDVQPDDNDGFPNPHVYRFEPYTRSEIIVSASASGHARAVPEPASTVVWGLLTVLVFASSGFKAIMRRRATDSTTIDQ